MSTIREKLISFGTGCVKTLQLIPEIGKNLVNEVDGVEKIVSFAQASFKLYNGKENRLSEGMGTLKGIFDGCSTGLQPFHIINTIDSGLNLGKENWAVRIKYIFTTTLSAIDFANFLDTIKVIDLSWIVNGIGKTAYLKVLVTDIGSKCFFSSFIIVGAAIDSYIQWDKITKCKTEFRSSGALLQTWKDHRIALDNVPAHANIDHVWANFKTDWEAECKEPMDFEVRAKEILSRRELMSKKINERIALHFKGNSHWDAAWYNAFGNLILDGLKILGQLATIIGTAFAVACFAQTSTLMLTYFLVLATLTLSKKIAEVMYRTELAPLRS